MKKNVFDFFLINICKYARMQEFFLLGHESFGVIHFGITRDVLKL